MCRPSLVIAILGGVAALYLLTSSDLTATPMAALSPAAIEGLSASSVVQPIDCIKYCVKAEKCRRNPSTGHVVCEPCRSGTPRCACKQWATACPGGHY
jgi:hypothetical protein